MKMLNKVILSGCLLIGILLGSDPGVAGIITVNTPAGDLDDSSGGGLCSFREAMQNIASETQQFTDCPAPGTSPFEIRFDASVVLITLDGTTPSSIVNELTVQGPIILDGDNLSGIILDAAGSANLTVNLVTLQNNGLSPGLSAPAIRVRGDSSLTVNGSVFDGNFANTGAAIDAISSGVVRINGSTFTQNEARDYGGAINKSQGAELFISGSLFGGPLLGNVAGLSGGAIYLNGTLAFESVVLAGVSFLGNEANGATSVQGGGAIYVQGAVADSTITIVGCEFGSAVPFTGNTADRGGAIYNRTTIGMINSDVTDLLSGGIVGSEFVGNTAEGPAGVNGLGGAIFNTGSLHVYHSAFSGNSSTNSGGGAIGDNQMVARELLIANSTFSGNQAATDGGAINMFNGAGEAVLRNVTVSGNTAVGLGREIFANGDVDLGNTIVANSDAGANCAGSGTFTDSGGNLQFDLGSNLSCGVASSLDPLLATLVGNPGPILVSTMALLAGSPALGNGDSGICGGFPVNGLDARGLIRPGTCDVGAFEGGDSARVVINEVDYDQGGTDDHEFIELFNAGSESVDLGNFFVELIDGAGDGATIYDVIDLPSFMLSAGGYYVVCGQTGMGIPLANCDLDYSVDTDFLQDGDPDAVGLRLSGLIVDALGYGVGNTAFPYTETAGAGGDLPGEMFFGLSRKIDGGDSGNNSVDFEGRCATPREPNSGDSTACNMVPVELLGFSVN